MSEEEFERGTYFREFNHPSVNGKVVLGMTDEFPGGRAVRLAERDESSDEYIDYVQPVRQLYDELNLGICVEDGKLSEERLEKVEASL